VQGAVEEATDGRDDDESKDEQREDKPGSAAAGFFGGLGDAEDVDEDGCEEVEQAHGISVGAYRS